ncbi:hypothetical protein [Bradyrhizobium sp. USDA 4473]
MSVVLACALRDEWCDQDNLVDHHVLMARRLLIDLIGGEPAMELRGQFA